MDSNTEKRVFLPRPIRFSKSSDKYCQLRFTRNFSIRVKNGTPNAPRKQRFPIIDANKISKRFFRLSVRTITSDRFASFVFVLFCFHCVPEPSGKRKRSDFKPKLRFDAYAHRYTPKFADHFYRKKKKTALNDFKNSNTRDRCSVAVKTYEDTRLRLRRLNAFIGEHVSNLKNKK